MKRMSKSNSTEKNLDDIPPDVRISALQSEVNYWKTRYKLLEKYGNVPQKEMTVEEWIKAVDNFDHRDEIEKEHDE